MKKIIPTIFANNKKEFDEKFRNLIGISNFFQIDFMDGKFVKGKSVKLSEIPNLKETGKKFEAHLMTKHPEKKFAKLKRKGFRKVIFHYESTKKPERIIKRAKNLGLVCFMAINPETSVKKISPLLKETGGILVMGVHPGKEHQNLILGTYKKIREIKKHSPRTTVQIDGGVNLQTARKLKLAGADILNTGSFVSSSKNPHEALRKLRKIFT